jgi:hypothetical protein
MSRNRITLLTGLAAGFVLGARAGRERYEQMKKVARKAADSPAAQQAAGALQAQSAALLKSATRRVTRQVSGRVPWRAQGAGRGTRDHGPGRPADAKETPGASADQQVAGQRPLAAASDPGNGRSVS